MCLDSVSKLHKSALHRTTWQKGFKVTQLIAYNNHFGFYSGYRLPGTRDTYYGKFDHAYHNRKPCNNYGPVYPLGFHVLKTLKDAKNYHSNAKSLTTLTSEQVGKLLALGTTTGTKDYGNYYIFPVLYRKVVATGNQGSGSHPQMCDIALEMKMPTPPQLSTKALAKLLPKLELMKAKAALDQAKTKKACAVRDLVASKKNTATSKITYQKWYTRALKQAKLDLDSRMKDADKQLAQFERGVVTSDKEVVRATRVLRAARKAATKRTTKAK